MHTSKPTEVLLALLITITLLFISPSRSVPTRPARQKSSKYMKPIISPTSNEFSISRSRSSNSSFVKPLPVISNSITLKYIQPAHEEIEGKGSLVTMNLQTLYPVLNIDDLRGLYNLSCPVTPDPDSEFEDISIQLSDVSRIRKWPKNMLLLVGHQWSCGINVSARKSRPMTWW
ncbi:hypothetical protein BKA69DRAFT_1049476 [Paraphysoderma sedebokerense]|nr:hypothetical protein BKA69DRAFT_1049476 [Paraphysoderma sedebokerense]